MSLSTGSRRWAYVDLDLGCAFFPENAVEPAVDISCRRALHRRACCATVRWCLFASPQFAFAPLGLLRPRSAPRTFLGWAAAQAWAFDSASVELFFAKEDADELALCARSALVASRVASSGAGSLPLARSRRRRRCSPGLRGCACVQCASGRAKLLRGARRAGCAALGLGLVGESKGREGRREARPTAGARGLHARHGTTYAEWRRTGLCEGSARADGGVGPAGGSMQRQSTGRSQCLRSGRSVAVG